LYTEKVTVLKERIININDDYDGDGLSNLEEAYFGTDPYNFDTDGEGISDFDEVKKKNGYFTDPLNPDTDRDGIYDSTEYKLSKNPLQKNENSSVVRTVSSMSQSVTVSVYGDNNLTICPIKVFESDSILLKSIKGVVGNPVEVSLNGYKMDHASITFSYSDSDFKDISEEDNLTIYWVDYKNNKLVPLADDKVSIDKVNNKIIGIVSHFSVYIAGPKNLLDIYGNKNVVFAIDESGSMRFYDANFSRRAVVSRFISDMNTQTTTASIVTISSSASTKVPFTSDIELLKQGMENFPPCDSSYTDICDGLVEAENNFDSSSSASKYVILLSDGLLDIGESGDSIVDKARIMAGKNIRIITVALGSKANVGLLTKIAEATGGECFSINNDESLTVDQQNTEIYKVYSKIYDILSWGGSDQNFPYIPDFDGREKPILNITSGPYVVNDPVGISAECSDAYKMVVKIDEPDTDPASATVNYFDDRKNPLVSFNFDLKYEGSYIIIAVADYESDAPRQTSKVIYASDESSVITTNITDNSITWYVTNAKYKSLGIYDNNGNLVNGLDFINDTGTLTATGLSSSTTYKAVLTDTNANVISAIYAITLSIEDAEAEQIAIRTYNNFFMDSRGSSPQTAANTKVTPEVAIEVLKNLSKGELPWRPELSQNGGSAFFTTEGDPYTGIDPTKNFKIDVEIAIPQNALVFDESILKEIYYRHKDAIRVDAEQKFRSYNDIPSDKPFTTKQRNSFEKYYLHRCAERLMWDEVGTRVRTSSVKVGEVILQNSMFSEHQGDGKFAVVADASKIQVKGGITRLSELVKERGVAAEPVLVETAEAMATRLKWVGRVQTAFRYGGKVLIVVGVASDVYKVYVAEDKVKAVVESAGGWAGATAGAAAFASWFAPADVAGPWAWVAHGVGTLAAGGIGYWIGSETTRTIYELIVEE